MILMMKPITIALKVMYIIIYSGLEEIKMNQKFNNSKYLC